MRRLLDLRIVRWQTKLGYVAVVWFVGYPIAAVLAGVGAPPIVMTIVIGWLLNFLAILLGARIFRGVGEDIAPPRPWWQMTARPTLSRRLGKIFVAWAVLALPAIVIGGLGIDPGGNVTSVDFPGALGTFIFCAALAFLYLNSAVRLTRLGVLPLAPTFRPKLLIK